MGKNEKTGLGRALVKHHNQMLQQSNEKGRFYKNQHKKVLESITDVNDIDAVIQEADEAQRLFAFDHPAPNVLINLTHLENMVNRMESLVSRELNSLRPPWNVGMTAEELDANERQALLIWRRSLARLEGNENLVLTPFEKNLDIWRQLWRVLERSDLLVMVVDARDPLFYRCPDLEIRLVIKLSGNSTYAYLGELVLVIHGRWVATSNPFALFLGFGEWWAFSASLTGPDVAA
ncbi:GTPase LSG1-1 [Vitis vinifera]|uniref:GTPase LSG1-1 n=1 Tax=Vitis vinifera TaxID=29760 RepID=A0A438IFK9_VITVI|nr:GTPase LSG1-1 [Vitis vinifera]